MYSVFSTSPLPSIEYIYFLLKSEWILIDGTERFQKQSNRNRFHLLSATGVQSLNIPLQHKQLYESKMCEVKIADVNNFRRTQWRCIESSYNNSPYFEFLKDEFKDVFFSEELSLFKNNNQLLLWILKQLKTEKEIRFETEINFKELSISNDYRKFSSIKNHALIHKDFIPEKYNQVFSYKFGFEPNLSIIDLIFNCGPASLRYLQ